MAINKYIVVIILQHIHISNHYIVCLKEIQCVYVNYISIKWGGVRAQTAK